MAGLSLLFAQVCLMDAARAFRRLSDEFKRDFGHDTKIFPDHEC